MTFCRDDFAGDETFEAVVDEVWLVAEGGGVLGGAADGGVHAGGVATGCHDGEAWFLRRVHGKMCKGGPSKFGAEGEGAYRLRYCRARRFAVAMVLRWSLAVNSGCLL